jgi:hypothetical protein
MFYDERINFLLVAFRDGGSWSTAAMQMDDVPTSKCFSNIAEPVQ